MILCTYDQRSELLFNVVQTLLNIPDDRYLKLTSVEPNDSGFFIRYSRLVESDLWASGDVQIYNSQLLLMLLTNR